MAKHFSRLSFALATAFYRLRMINRVVDVSVTTNIM